MANRRLRGLPAKGMCIGHSGAQHTENTKLYPFPRVPPSSWRQNLRREDEEKPKRRLEENVGVRERSKRGNKKARKNERKRGVVVITGQEERIG